MTVRRQKIMRRDSHGLAAVEMAIVLPIVMLLVLPIGEVGRAFIQYSRLSHRVQVGARFVADNAYQGSTGIPSLTNTVRAQARNLVVYGTTAGVGTPAVPSLTPALINVSVSPAGIVRVWVDYPYQSVVGGVLPMFGLGSDIVTGTLVLRPSSTMRAL